MRWIIQMKFLSSVPHARRLLHESGLLSLSFLLRVPSDRSFCLEMCHMHPGFLSAWWPRSPADVLQGSSVSLPRGKVEVA